MYVLSQGSVADPATNATTNGRGQSVLVRRMPFANQQPRSFQYEAPAHGAGRAAVAAVLDFVGQCDLHAGQLLIKPAKLVDADMESGFGFRALGIDHQITRAAACGAQDITR